MSVYLRDGLTQYEKDYLQRLLRAERGVKKAVFLSRDEALELFRRELKGQEALIQGLGGNPLPDSFELVLERTHAEPERLETLAKKMSGWRGVEEVSYGKQGARTLSGLIKALTYGGTALAILLGVSVVFIISNSVRLALYSREQEIELMQWIGATRGFIQWPFLIEGTMLAMLGSALSVGILVSLYYALPPEAALFLSQSNGLDFLPLPVVAYMTIGGGLLGLAGGFIAVSRSLE
jgi:cell division transport system permease protein